MLRNARCSVWYFARLFSRRWWQGHQNAMEIHRALEVARTSVPGNWNSKLSDLQYKPRLFRTKRLKSIFIQDKPIQYARTRFFSDRFHGARLFGPLLSISRVCFSMIPYSFNLITRKRKGVAILAQPETGKYNHYSFQERGWSIRVLSAVLLSMLSDIQGILEWQHRKEVLNSSESEPAYQSTQQNLHLWAYYSQVDG